jgi:alanine-alpha-ketoisovalerate/valine-pyruvate aminotransferase
MVLVGERLKVAFLIFPNYCLGRGLMDVATNEYVTQYKQLAADFIEVGDTSFRSPFEWDIIGRNLFAMGLQAVFFFLFTLFCE